MTSDQVAVNKYQRWSYEEVVQLVAAFYTYGRNFHELQKVIPNRTVTYIKYKIYQLETYKSGSYSSISPIQSNEVSLRSATNSLYVASGYPQQPFLLSGNAGYHPGWSKVFAAMQ